MDSQQSQKGPDNSDSRFRGFVRKAAGPVGAVVLILVVIAVVGLSLRWIIGGRGRGTEDGIVCTVPEDGMKGSDRDSEPAGAYFVDQEVILTGPAGDIAELLDQLRQGKLPNDQAIPLIPVESCTLKRWSLRGPKTEMNLYAVGTDSSVVDVLAAVEESRYADTVVVDPNYLVGLLGTSLCGSAHGVRPSPWELVAYAHGVRPSPTGPDGPASEASAAAFRNQWAFAQLGLSPDALTGLHSGADSTTGSGVRVGVLDTSPFSEMMAGAADADATSSPHTVELSATHGVTPSWELELAFPSTVALKAAGAEAPADLSDHGLFVAGLIHALAPGSQIQLVRILDEHGCGDLFTLNKAIYDFVERADADRKALDGAVINLSLGVQKPRPGEEKEEQQAEGDQPAQETDAVAEETKILINDSVESLQAVVEHAAAQGVVVVAATGNDSWAGAVPLSPHLPAAYPHVIGVSGSNLQRQRSCFSNWGDVAAPAGDGAFDAVLQAKVLEETGIKTDCLPAVETCTGDCPTALISLVDNVAKGYAYWTGTSFAAPLTSGLSALVMEKGVSRCFWWPRWLAPAEVFNAVRCGAPTPDGVINVPATLERCMP